MLECTLRIEIRSTHLNAAAMARFQEVLRKGFQMLVDPALQFLSAEPTPVRARQIEQELQGAARKLCLRFLEWLFNQVAQTELPQRVRVGTEEYRRREPRRLKLATLFGQAEVWREVLEPLTEGERCRVPFDEWVGVLPGHVSAALAEKIARLSASGTQSEVRQQLLEENGQSLSVDRLRNMTAGIGAAVEPFIEPEQAWQLLQWLKQAESSRGKHRPTLSVGRDGCDLPIRDEPEYKVGTVATVSVLDRRGRRVGTMYLGRMPEAGQGTLTRKLTSLLTAVLGVHPGEPRLVYVTDGGHHEEAYFQALRRLRHPVTNAKLCWERVVDFFHVCEYVTKLAELRFGKGRAASGWARKMRRILRDKPSGAKRVIHSIAAHHQHVVLTRSQEKEYRTYLNYIRKRIRWMDYHGLRKRGMPIGSGVTEAACKTVFTQRMKRSGMKWNREDGQPVLTLRCLVLSGIWPAVYQAHLEHLVNTIPEPLRPTTYARPTRKHPHQAA